MVHCPLLLFTATLTRGRNERIGKGKRRGFTPGALYSPEFNIKVFFVNNFTDENTISFLHCGAHCTGKPARQAHSSAGAAEKGTSIEYIGNRIPYRDTSIKI